MQINADVENQDGSTGDFSHHGTCTTPVDATTRIAKDHASPFGRILADRISYTHRRYAAGCEQDDRTLNVCQMTKLLEVSK